MVPNPYESPQSVAPKRAPRVLRTGYHLGWFEFVVVSGLALFVLTAIGHRCQLWNGWAYIRSPLVVVERIGLLGNLLAIPVLLIRSFYFLYRKRFIVALVALLLCFLAIVTMVAAVTIDERTFIVT